jgi:ABC-type methionine transport system permease subunit
MTDTIIILSVLVAAAVACIIGLIVITFREKKMKEKPTYYSAVGNWLSGKRR